MMFLDVTVEFVFDYFQNRVWQRDYRDRRALQPESIYVSEMLPPPSYMDNPINAVTTRFVKTATNKMRCPIFTLAWTPEGRRLVTGASSGEFTLWNGLTFNFETILQVGWLVGCFCFNYRFLQIYSSRKISVLGTRCTCSNNGLVTQ